MLDHYDQLKADWMRQTPEAWWGTLRKVDVDAASAGDALNGTKKASYLEDHDPAKRKRRREGPHR